MTDAALKDSIRALGAWDRIEKVCIAIGRAAKAAGLPYWRAFEIWYGRAKRVSDIERQQIRAALKLKTERDARHELKQLKLDILRIEEKLRQTDEDFYRPEIDRLGETLRPRR